MQGWDHVYLADRAHPACTRWAGRTRSLRPACANRLCCFGIPNNVLVLWKKMHEMWMCPPSCTLWFWHLHGAAAWAPRPGMGALTAGGGRMPSTRGTPCASRRGAHMTAFQVMQVQVALICGIDAHQRSLAATAWHCTPQLQWLWWCCAHMLHTCTVHVQASWLTGSQRHAQVIGHAQVLMVAGTTLHTLIAGAVRPAVRFDI